MTDDLISRQAAIDAMETWDKFGCDPDGKLVRYDDDKHYIPYVHYEDMVHAIKHLPSAQLAQDLTKGCTDTISRAAVVDVIEGVDWYHQNQHGEMVHGANDDEHQAWYKADDIYKAIESVPTAQPERTCVNCGRTANNGGWYADGGTRCPIEEHYALPKDGFCHLWEKRNVTDDDYPEKRTDE